MLPNVSDEGIRLDDVMETKLQRVLKVVPRTRKPRLFRLFPSATQPLELTLPATLGRDQSCDIVVDDESISRQHARMDLQDGNLVLSDLNSTNGTFINRRRLQPRAALFSGDIVRLGDVVLLLRQCDAAEPGTSTIDDQSPLVGGISLFAVRRNIQLLGPAPLRILVTGESGTGKELVAREFRSWCP